jgi:uncharacterized protein
MTQSKQVFRILCLDGGGIRGAFTAGVLQAIERDILQGSIAEHCDLIAGTSTGGLIAIALAFGKSPNDIYNFFEDKSVNIFGKSGFIYSILRWLQKPLFAPYATQKVEEQISCLIGKNEFFGKAKNRLIIPAYNADAGNVHIFKHLLSSDLDSAGFQSRCQILGVDPASYSRFETLHAAEVGSASAAAPTFFKPKQIDQLKQCYIDGGVWANSPVLPAIAEALGPLGISLDQIRVLSIGTRFETLKVGMYKRQLGGVIPWNVGVLDLLMNAQAAGSIGTAGWMLGKQQFLRIDDRFDDHFDKNSPKDKKPSFDDIRTVTHLKVRADEIVKKKQIELSNLLKEWI